MAIQLDEPEVEVTAARLARITGLSIQDVIKAALKEKEREFDWGRRGSEERLAAKLAWFAELDARPRTYDPRTWREIEREEEYDEFGCPI